ncbi:MAG: metallophosphoesterase [Bacteroidaceae bacterium]|nr:metallophosphoesterase [Bacteroidaceae bacterium]
MNLFWILTLLLLPLLGVSYVLWHVWVILPVGGVWRTVITGLGLLCFLTLFLDFTGQLERLPMPVARLLYNIGTSTLIVILYLGMIFIALDLGRLFHLVPRNWLYSNWMATACISLVMLVTFVYGRIHYNNKVYVPLWIDTKKSLPQDYKILMASDLHLGYHNGRKELARWVDIMNSEQPDLILIAGDIIDVSIRPLIEEDMASEFRRLKAPVYACLGNHEYYSGAPQAVRFYKEAGIHLLVDKAVEALPGVVVVGRNDRMYRKRKSPAELSQLTDRTKYTILLDHQPFDLNEAEQAGFDFQLSGHTHYGQVWPLSWVTNLMYECAWGSHQRGQTHYYVSSGLGIWGGRFRIGTQSEYVVATIHSRYLELLDFFNGHERLPK